MPIRLILMGLLLLALIFWTLPPISVSARRQIARWATRIAIGAALLILLRLGLPWLAVIGTALVAVLRFAMPVVFRLLPFWLDRHVKPNGAKIPGQDPGAAGFRRPQDMTRAHALEILDLHEGASRDEIINAYRELIKKVHPDRGGSSYLAAEVNRARDVLLSEDAK